MKSNRHVPIIYGIVFLVLAAYLVIWVGGFIAIIGAAACTLFGWASLKTGLFATNHEIEELTGVRELSDETTKKFQDRV